MITENHIFFGLGTILVGSSAFPSKITFTPTAAAHSVGERVDYGVEASGETISIPLDLDSYQELSQKLLQVEKRETDSFSFGGYTFDFSSYNPESIRVIREHAKWAMTSYLVAVAC